ncbi:MAG: methyltransferase domain-containing protein [Pseudonocardiaceae bacterium]
MPTLSPTTSLNRLRQAVARSPALPELSGLHYARTHAAYEAASDQRAGLQAWLPRQLPPLLDAGPPHGGEPLRVLGVGVGDGSVDAPLADALAAQGRRVRYTGIEPHAMSAAGFVVRLAALPADSLTVTAVAGEFADHEAAVPADLVHFVHSLYYMADLGATLDHALAMLRPGGLLVTATAPRHPLCVLTELLSPGNGHRLWCAEDVTAELLARRLKVRSETMVAELDLRGLLIDPHGAGEPLLDFLVGAGTSTMAVEVRELVMAYLAEVALPGRSGVVPHPIDITITRVP